MYIKEKKNKNGEISYEMRCSVKDALTGNFKSLVKTVKLPPNVTGKKAIKDFISKAQLEWKEKLTNGARILNEQNANIRFVDFANQFIEDILVNKPTAYNYYNSSKAHLETIKPKLGKYLLSELTQPVIQEFCKWLCSRTYEKLTIIAKPALLTLINDRHIVLHHIAKGCQIADTTLYAALHGQSVRKSTATKICEYLQIPLKQYFSIEKEVKRYSYSANNGVKVFLHGVLHEAVRQGKIEHNYASTKYTYAVTGDKGTKIILENANEYRQFIECINKETDLRKKTAFACYIYLGLRNAETVGLAWKNIDLEDNTISIVQNTIYAGKKFGTVTKGTKTKSSNRTIGIPTTLTNILKEYKVWWENEKKNHGDLWANTDKLFVQNNGKDMCGFTLAGWLKEFEIKNGLKNVTPHGLRHSTITFLVANGVDVKTVAARVGHSDVQTTLNIYSHFLKEADREAANKIDEIIGA